MLVSDRNGNPKALTAKEFALAAASAGGEHKMRTGSLQDPINLKLLQQLLNGNVVVVRNGEGNLGVAVPTAENTFLAYIGGSLQFVSTIPRSNLFNTSEISSQSGKIATIGCETGGQTSLGFFTGSGDFLSVVDGIPVAKYYSDLDEAEDFDYILGGSDGALKKLLPVEGKVLAEEDGKWVLKTAVGEDVWVGSNIYTKNYTNPASLTFSEAAIPFGSGVPSTAKMVQLRLCHLADLQTYYCTVRISINNVEVLVGQNSGSFQSHHDSVVLYVPYGSGTFSIDSSVVPYNNASGSYAGGAFTAQVLSYK